MYAALNYLKRDSERDNVHIERGVIYDKDA